MMRTPVVTLALMILTGCATHGRAVQCDGRLEAINIPASTTTEDGPRSSSSTADLVAEDES